MINKKNTWSLADMKFLFSCSTRHLIRLLRSLVSYRVNHLKRNSISTHAYVLFSIYYLVIIFKLLSQHIPVFFFVIDAVETSQKSVSLTDSDNQASQEGEESQNTERKTESYSNSVALVMAFLAAENENRQLKDLPRADFDRIPERFLLSVGTNSITDNFVYWKLRP